MKSRKYVSILYEGTFNRVQIQKNNVKEPKFKLNSDWISIILCFNFNGSCTVKGIRNLFRIFFYSDSGHPPKYLLTAPNDT